MAVSVAVAVAVTVTVSVAVRTDQPQNSSPNFIHLVNLKLRMYPDIYKRHSFPDSQKLGENVSTEEDPRAQQK